MQEEWRATHLSHYEVSNMGRVRSYFKRGGQGRQIIATARVMTPGRQKGYPHVTLYDLDGGKQTHRVHRLVAAAFLGPCPSGQEVRHKDHDRENARVENLEYGTRVENMRDSVATDRYHTAKLSIDQVRTIRRMYRDEGVIQVRLAAQFGVGQGQISAIVRGAKWADV